MKFKKIRELEKGLESGVISKEEFEEKKKEIESMPEHYDEEKPVEEEKESKFGTERILLLGVALIVLIFVGIFSLKFFNQEQPETIDELHELNLKGKLKPDRGYIFDDAYSFVLFDDLWYTQLLSPGGTRLYNIQFRYGPKDVENIKISGSLNNSLLNNATEYYATFNPSGGNFSHIALAVSDFNQHMTNIFFKRPIAACDRNETLACANRPIITCDNTGSLVLYVKEEEDLRVDFDGNCIVVGGNSFDLVKGIDRVLYDFYNII